jgi:hypothetical protein
MHLLPHLDMLAYAWLELVVVTCIAAAAGYAGGWVATRSFRKQIGI